MDYISQNELKKMLLFSSERIERDKEQVNKINVFPVPDQDTGTNLSATLKGIKSNIENRDFESIAELSDSVLDGALTAAQGNTGIIYTGFLAGFFPCIAEEKELTAEKMGIAFEKGYERAKDSIQDPKEGTMLDVIKAFALAVKDYSKEEKDIVKNFYYALEKANEALLDTPNKMEVLKKAGVVDAGGLGFLMILETYLDTLKEQEDPFIIKKEKETEIVRPKRFIQILSNRYEVVALLDDGYYDEKQVRDKLNHMGNCLDIIKIGNRTKIHIHTDMPYEVRDIVKKMGNIENLRIEDMTKEVTGQKSVENVSIGVVTDERAGLNSKIIGHYDIEVIPLRIIWEEGENVAGENICQRIKEAKEKGISSCPKIDPILPEFFMESYKTQLQKFDDVLCITSSSSLSDNYSSAMKGKELLSEDEKKRVHIIDSKNISAGQSILILEALEMIAEQRKIDEIVRKIDNIIEKANLYCAVEKSDWWNQEKKPSWFSKKPRYSLGEMKKGKIVHVENIKSTNFAEAIFKRIEKVSKKDIENNKRIRAVIAHGDNIEEAEKLKKLLKGIKKTDISFINITDPVTSINACPQSLLIGWIIK